jgi:hypothetical protein
VLQQPRTLRPPVRINRERYGGATYAEVEMRLLAASACALALGGASARPAAAPGAPADGWWRGPASQLRGGPSRKLQTLLPRWTTEHHDVRNRYAVQQTVHKRCMLRYPRLTTNACLHSALPVASLVASPPRLTYSLTVQRPCEHGRAGRSGTSRTLGCLYPECGGSPVTAPIMPLATTRQLDCFRRLPRSTQVGSRC